MKAHEYRKLHADVAALEKLLKQIPQSSVIERMSLTERKTELEEILAACNQEEREPVRARLTFRGKPVVGTHGMFAEFGAAIVGAFSEAVAAIGASQNVPLGARGVIPNKDDFRFLITGTAKGSFGFELEEVAREDMLLPPESQIAAAIEQIKVIMKATLGDDDELMEAVSDADIRALEKIRAFLQILADEEAVCALDFGDDVFRFTDVGQVRRSANRLNNENIHEHDETLLGQFQGVLPKQRTFEFVRSQSQEVISGKVGTPIEDASQINSYLGRNVSISVRVKQIGGGRPRYTLLSFSVEGLA